MLSQGEILINGTPISKMRQWFVRNTGYVRQLATYYYNELTVRENLLFSMNMQAMRGMTLRQKLERVEQVIREVREGGKEGGREGGGYDDIRTWCMCAACTKQATFSEST